MPLHELPLQKCGTGHWLTEACPKGECDLLVFEKDTVVLKSLAAVAAAVRETTGSDKPLPPPEKAASRLARLQIASEAVEEAVLSVAEKAAERAKRYREKKKLEDPEYLERERMRKRRKSER